MYNGKIMKKLAIVIFTFLFLANTVVVSAWAKPCLMNGEQPAMEQMNSQNMDDMPCHEEQDQQQNHSHCDGICLCVHVSTSSNFLSNPAGALYPPVVKSMRVMPRDDVMASKHYSPPHRPPKHIS